MLLFTIMAYSSTPHVGMALQKWWPHWLKCTNDRYAWNVISWHPLWAISDIIHACMSNRTTNFAGKHHWSTRLASHWNGQYVYLLIFFLLLPHDNGEDITILMQTKNTNHYKDLFGSTSVVLVSTYCQLGILTSVSESDSTASGASTDDK